MKNVFPEMQLEFVNIEWNKYFGDYTITFKDKEDKSYGCVIGPKYFPINIGQGLNAIQETYLEKYKEPELIEQKIAVATFMINNNDNKTFISAENLKLSQEWHQANIGAGNNPEVSMIVAVAIEKKSKPIKVGHIILEFSPVMCPLFYE